MEISVSFLVYPSKPSDPIPIIFSPYKSVFFYILSNHYFKQNEYKRFKDVVKQITMDKASINNVVSDEVIKGKVSTQKDKLKKLRGL